MHVYRKLQALSVTLCFCFLISNANAQADGRAVHVRLSNLLTSGHISKVTIIHVPSDIQTRTRLDQRALRALSPIEFSFIKLDEGGFLDTLRSAVGEIRTARVAEVHEVRWGILLVDSAGKEQAAIFLDSTGRFIQVDDGRFLVQGQMLTSIKQMIRDSIR